MTSNHFLIYASFALFVVLEYEILSLPLMEISILSSTKHFPLFQFHYLQREFELSPTHIGIYPVMSVQIRRSLILFKIPRVF